MSRFPTWIIIPGLGESTADKPYRLIRNHLKACGFQVIAVKINWNRTTMTDWIRQAKNLVTKATSPIVGMFGFSMGALIALAVAGDIRPKRVIAASASPYFTEALKLFSPKLMRRVKRYIGKKELAEYWKYHAKYLTLFKGRTTFLYGEKDFEMVPKAVALLRRRMSGRSETIVAPKAPHDLSHPNYLKACLASIGTPKKKKPRH